MIFDPTRYAIRYWCDLNPGTGFNNAARGYLKAFDVLGLDSRHIHLAPAVLSDFGAHDDDTFDWTAPYTHRVSADDIVSAIQRKVEPPPPWNDDNTKINIVHLSPGLIAAGGYHTTVGDRYNVAITAWETDRLQQRPLLRNDGRSITVVDALNEYDEIWVPTKFNHDAFVKSGVTKPIYIIRHALLPEFLTAPLVRPEEPFTFYSMGAWNARKDPGALLQSYFRCGWGATTSMDLQLYCVPPTRDPRVMVAHQERARGELESILDALPDRYNIPSFGLHTSKYVPLDEVLQRHQRGAAYVSMSHGEGFGLPLLEAAAMGRRVIAGGPWVEELSKNAGVVSDGGLIDCVSTSLTPIVPMPYECGGYEVGQHWWSIDPDEMTKKLKAAGEERPTVKDRDFDIAFKWAERVRSHYSPVGVSAQIGDRLRAIHEVLHGTGW